MAKALKFRAHAGRQRISRSLSASVAQQTASARSAMQGILSNYKRLIEHLEGVTPEILYDALEPTFEKSQVYCPVLTGAMRDSGYLVITSFRGTPSVEMGYGKDGKPEYTATVHENMEWRHKDPTRAKWLQVALAEDEAAIQGRIASKYGEVFS